MRLSSILALGVGLLALLASPMQAEAASSSALALRAALGAEPKADGAEAASESSSSEEAKQPVKQVKQGPAAKTVAVPAGCTGGHTTVVHNKNVLVHNPRFKERCAGSNPKA